MSKKEGESAIIPWSGFASSDLDPYAKALAPVEAERQPVSLVGAILFDQKKQMIVVASDASGNLHTGLAKATEDFEIDEVNVASPRILELSKYKSVQVAQIGVAAIRIETTETLRQAESAVHARITLTDPIDGRKHALDLLERELLDFVVGNAGGIAPFFGPGLTDEYALVFEEKVNDSLRARALFVHPENMDYSLNSIRGVEEFFRRLNYEFLKKTSVDPKVREIVKRLDAEREANRIPESFARVEILKAQLLANSRLAALTGLQKYKDFVSSEIALMTQKRSRLAELFSSSSTSSLINVSQAIETAIQKTMLTDDSSAGTFLVTEPEKDQRRRINLKTRDARRIYDYYHDYLKDDFGTMRGEFVTGAMNEYFRAVIDYLADRARTQKGRLMGSVEEWEDAVQLLKELSSTYYGMNQQLKGYLDEDDSYIVSNRVFNGDNYPESYRYTVSYIISKLLRIVAQKQAQALKQRFDDDRARTLGQ